MTPELLDILYNHKPICESLIQNGFEHASRLFHRRARSLPALTDQNLPELRRIYLTSLNKSLYNFILYEWDLSLAQLCYENKALSHGEEIRLQESFLRAGDAILSSYAYCLRGDNACPCHMKQACRYIDSHLDEEITLDMLASHVFLSKTYLSQIFKETVGMNFSDYLSRRRLTRARRLLLTTDLKIDQIAEKCGFFSSTYFSTVFKKNTHMTPRTFRQRFAGTARHDHTLQSVPDQIPVPSLSGQTHE